MMSAKEDHKCCFQWRSPLFAWSLIIFIVLFGCFFFLLSKKDEGFLRENYEYINIGMQYSEVVRILGPPRNTEIIQDSLDLSEYEISNLTKNGTANVGGLRRAWWLKPKKATIEVIYDEKGVVVYKFFYPPSTDTPPPPSDYYEKIRRWIFGNN